MGFARTYSSICFLKNQLPRSDIVEFMTVLQTQKIKTLNLFDLSNASQNDLIAVIKGINLTHSNLSEKKKKKKKRVKHFQIKKKK